MARCLAIVRAVRSAKARRSVFGVVVASLARTSADRRIDMVIPLAWGRYWPPLGIDLLSQIRFVLSSPFVVFL